jgi:hypothetical protein
LECLNDCDIGILALRDFAAGEIWSLHYCKKWFMWKSSEILMK